MRYLIQKVKELAYPTSTLLVPNSPTEVGNHTLSGHGNECISKFFHGLFKDDSLMLNIGKY